MRICNIYLIIAITLVVCLVTAYLYYVLLYDETLCTIVDFYRSKVSVTSYYYYYYVIVSYNISDKSYNKTFCTSCDIDSDIYDGINEKMPGETIICYYQITNPSNVDLDDTHHRVKYPVHFILYCIIGTIVLFCWIVSQTYIPLTENIILFIQAVNSYRYRPNTIV